MLRIVVNNIDLDIQGVQISLRLLSPIFNDIGTHSYSFSLSATEKNKQVLGYPSRLSRKSLNNTEFSCSVFFEGVLIIEGKLSVSDSNHNIIECYLKAGNGEVFSEFKKKKLTDLVLGGQRTLGTSFSDVIAYYEDVITGTSDDYDFAIFPIRNESFYDGTNFETYHQSDIKYINYYNNGFVISPTMPESHVPFPYLGYVIDQIFSEHGFTIDKNLYRSDPDLKKLVIYNTYSWDSWETAGGGVYNRGPSLNIDLSKNVPDVNINDFLKNLTKLFAIGIFPEIVNRKVTIKRYKDIILDHTYTDWSKDVFPIYNVSDEVLDGYELRFKADNQDEYYEQYVFEIDNYNLKDPVSTLLQLPSSGNENNDIRLVREYNAFYVWDIQDPYSPLGLWRFLCFNLVNYKSGEGEFENETDFSTLCTYPHLDDSHSSAPRQWLTPITKQVGNSDSIGDFKDNDFSPRLLFYRGMYLDGNGNNYPLGTYDVYDYLKNKRGDLALRWDGDYGLYENLWKEYLHWYIYVRRLVKFEKVMTPADLKNIKFYKKYRINGVNYLIKEINVTITDREIKPAKLDLYRV